MLFHKAANKTRILHRAQVTNAIADVFYNAKHRVDICGNSKFPSLIFSFEPIRRANFVLNETKYLGSITLNEPHQQAIYSNVREVIEQQYYTFDNLWNKSIVANEKIREIEEGIESEFYEIITDNEKAKNNLLILQSQ